MAIERERKFKLKYLPNNLPFDVIHQGYLLFDSSKQLRVRIINNEQGYITYKSDINHTDRHEYEYEIPIKDALELYNSTKYQIKKIRYTKNDKDYTAHIDIYSNGLCVVELEFQKELNTLPDFCGDEITGQKDFSNINLALKKLKK